MTPVYTTIANWFKDNNFYWRLLNKGRVIPDEADVQATLDEAVRMLYDEKPGTYLNVGRLIVERTDDGNDVYMFIGSYE